MKILKIGNGFIASHLRYNLIPERLYLDERLIEYVLNKHKPDVLINCIGYCGENNIDDCEVNKEKTTAANLIIPTILAHACDKLNIRLIHLGSGCCYYGPSPHAKPIRCVCEMFCYCKQKYIDTGWKETDPTTPKSFYSKTKYACDNILSSFANTTILRLRMPISSKHSPRNLLNKLISFKKVLEEPNSITFVSDLARAIDWVIEKEKVGTYHVVNPTPITHSVLLDKYKEYFPDHKYEKITKQELQKMVAAPRSNCILNANKIISEGFEFGDITSDVGSCIREFVENSKR